MITKKILEMVMDCKYITEKMKLRIARRIINHWERVLKKRKKNVI